MKTFSMRWVRVDLKSHVRDLTVSTVQMLPGWADYYDYETMIFGGEERYEKYMRRYNNINEAWQGHWEIVRHLRMTY